MITYWLIVVYGDVEPGLHGPYATKDYRDQHALKHRASDPDMNDGIYKLTIDEEVPLIESYSGGFFEGII